MAEKLREILDKLNNSEPKSNFALWKAMDLAKFIRTQMKEDLIYWLNHPEDWNSNNLHCQWIWLY